MAIGDKKSGGTWWKVLLGVLGGFFLGVGSVAGGVAIAGTVVKTKTLLGEENAAKYLGAQLQDKTILQIVMDTVQGKMKFDTLGDLNDITPLVGEYVASIKKSLNEFGCELTDEEMFSWEISSLSDELFGAVEDARLINVLGGDNPDNPEPIIKYLSYKTANGEYTTDSNGKLIDHHISDLLDGSYLQNKVDSMSLKMVFKEDEIANSPLLTALKDKSVKDLSKEGAFDDVKISSVMTINDDSSKILVSFRDKNTTIGGMSDAIDNLLLSDVIDINDDSPAILKAFNTRETKVSEMNETVNDLRLAEVMDIKEGDILYKLRNDKITELNNIDEKLTLDDVVKDRENLKFLSALDGNTPIKDIGNAINDMPLIDAFESNIYDGEGEDATINPTWKYMLAETESELKSFNGKTRKDNPFEGCACEEYTVGGEGDKGIDQMIENMTNNMKIATIDDLSTDGLVTVDSDFITAPIDIEGPVRYKKGQQFIDQGKTTFGDLTIEELTTLIAAGLEPKPVV